MRGGNVAESPAPRQKKMCHKESSEQRIAASEQGGDELNAEVDHNGPDPQPRVGDASSETTALSRGLVHPLVGLRARSSKCSVDRVTVAAPKALWMRKTAGRQL